MLRRGKFKRVCEAYERVTGRPVVASDLRAGVSLLARTALDDQHVEDPMAALAIPAAVHAFAGRQVHLLAPAHELAARRAVGLRPVAELLDLRVSLLGPEDEREQRAACYQADIVCAAVDEIAYDVLRDSLAWDADERVGVSRSVAVIDDIDTVLIDRAAAQPMITAFGSADDEWLKSAHEIAAQFQRDLHFTTTSDRGVALRYAGLEVLFTLIDLSRVLEEHVAIVDMVEAAIAARTLYHRGIDYEIIDGAVAAGSSLEPAIRAAIAVHHGHPPDETKRVLDITTVRHHVLGYEWVSGIGVLTELAARQLRELYRIRSRARTADPTVPDDAVFEDEQSRMRAMLDAIRDVRAGGQTVLVAASSAELISAAEAAGVSAADGITVVGPDDPVPDERHGALIGVGRHETRRRDIRLAATAEHAQFYLTTSELASMAGDQEQRTLSVAKQQEHAEMVSHYHSAREFMREFADVRDRHRTQLITRCNALLDDGDIVEGFRGLLHDHVDDLVRWYRKGELSYSDLVYRLGELYPCRLPPEPSTKLAAVIHADAERALIARIEKVDDKLGGGSTEEFIRKVIPSARGIFWQRHIVDLDTLAEVPRKAGRQRRVRELQRQADEQFESSWTEFVEHTIGYVFYLLLDD